VGWGGCTSQSGSANSQGQAAYGFRVSGGKDKQRKAPAVLFTFRRMEGGGRGHGKKQGRLVVIEKTVPFEKLGER